MKKKDACYPEGSEPIRETKVFDGLTYEKINSYALDSIIFNSRNVSVFSLDDCLNFLFLQENNKTFISVLFYSIENIWVAEFENVNNPFANMKRGKNGMMRAED